jgi:hypothetical protein
VQDDQAPDVPQQRSSWQRCARVRQPSFEEVKAAVERDQAWHHVQRPHMAMRSVCVLADLKHDQSIRTYKLLFKAAVFQCCATDLVE